MRCCYRRLSRREVEVCGEVWFSAFGVRKNDSGNVETDWRKNNCAKRNL